MINLYNSVKHSIRFRVSFILMSILLVWSIAASIVIWLSLSHEIRTMMDRELRETTKLIAEFARSHHRPNSDANQHHEDDKDDDEDEVEDHSRKRIALNPIEDINFVWQIVDTQSGKILDRSKQSPLKPMTQSAQDGIFPSEDGHWRINVSLLDAERKLFVGQNLERLTHLRHEIVEATLIFNVLMGVLVFLVVQWMIHREIRPIEALSQAVRQFDPMVESKLGDAPVFSSELLPIKNAVESLGGKLARRIEKERAFTAHASHALRTPIAGIEAQLAVAMKSAPDAIKEQLLLARLATSRLTALMRTLLSMFRDEGKPEINPTTLQEIKPLLPIEGITVDMQGDSVFHGDANWLITTLLNLIDNAQRFGASKVVIEHTTIQQEGRINNRLRMSDDGAGVSADKLEELKARLSDENTRPNGLGLALAQLVMKGHGGYLNFPTASQGFVVELIWPEVITNQKH